MRKLKNIKQQKSATSFAQKEIKNTRSGGSAMPPTHWNGIKMPCLAGSAIPVQKKSKEDNIAQENLFENDNQQKKPLSEEEAKLQLEKLKLTIRANSKNAKEKRTKLKEVKSRWKTFQSEKLEQGIEWNSVECESLFYEYFPEIAPIKAIPTIPVEKIPIPEPILPDLEIKPIEFSNQEIEPEKPEVEEANLAEDTFEEEINHQELAKLSKKEQKKYLTGIYGAKTYGWAGYIDDAKEKPALDIIEKVSADFTDFSPSMIYTLAAGEGFNLYLDNPSNYTSKNVINTQKEVSSYNDLGMDFAAKDLIKAKKKGLLPSNYNEGDEYENSTPFTRDEGGGPTTVYPVEFKNMESAIRGFSAVLDYRKQLFLDDASKYGYGTPTPDQIMYWTYYYYQRPSPKANDGGPKTLQRNGSFEFSPRPNGSQGATNQKSLERVATWHYIRTQGIFSN